MEAKLSKHFTQVLSNLMQVKQLQDGMDLDKLLECIKMYNQTIIFETHMNLILKKKKIRKTNFPSHISENIVKFVYLKKYGIMPNWDTDKGDLVISGFQKIIRIESKGSINLRNGPPTFGPTETWDYIYFVDGVDTLNFRYKVYEIKLKNSDTDWQNLKVSKTQTYGDQCVQSRRPRLNFDSIESQLGDKCQLIFDGPISELHDTS